MEDKEIKPFTIDESSEDKACILCKHMGYCAIRQFVTKLSIKRDGKTVDDEFSCSIFKEESQEDS